MSFNQQSNSDLNYWCHQCNRQVKPNNGLASLVCPHCGGDFLEELPSSQTQTRNNNIGNFSASSIPSMPQQNPPPPFFTTISEILQQLTQGLQNAGITIQGDIHFHNHNYNGGPHFIHIVSNNPTGGQQTPIPQIMK
jgi:predicted RNA-binding Zn-ribbon protein involved in translation (DUF1610 family)